MRCGRVLSTLHSIPALPCRGQRPVSRGAVTLSSRRSPRAGLLCASTASASAEADTARPTPPMEWEGLHHCGVLVRNLDESMEFYRDLLGLEINPARPDSKLPYRGAWFWLGPDMIHLMELPSPDPATGRPEHGGRDRHCCIGIKSLAPLRAALESRGIPYTSSQSGRPAIFFRDPDANTWEVGEQLAWR